MLHVMCSKMFSKSECLAENLQEMKKYIVNIFRECVKSVMPRNVIKNTFKYDSKTLYVKDTKFCVSNNIYVVGFGKAVLEMALEIEQILDGSLKKAIVSVPFGVQQDLNNSKVLVMEAAKNNIPDRYAVENTKVITNTISELNEDDILIILISGGGSALLCSPTVSLNDKILTTTILSSHGASIEQLNTVRKALSNVKGGKLIKFVEKSTVISLILSDIVGDPLNSIASGPTTPNNDSNDLPMKIIKQFGLLDKIPSTVLKALKDNNNSLNSIKVNKRVHNYIIGNNKIALLTGVECVKNDYTPVLLTKSLQGNIKFVSIFYSKLILFVCELYLNSVNIDEILKNQLTSDIHKIDREIDVVFLINQVIEASSKKRGLCILSGGEPTVKVQGGGLGGRNQELALRISANIEQDHDCLKQFNIMFFSGGTDGIDGPTDACGAFGYPGLVEIAQSQGLNPSQSIKDNDSYGFYSLFNGGKDLLKIGHTGTNVMDLHILIIKPK
ncbi:MOFRL-associated domain,MOFRL domain [Cinara cedri]|uniref:Glycerate kinase n=1 Tax=Cinara cedri TaxID=506608 RepID=A0A5E4MEN3_9HEMI|nr:MOFRL-associated domain,MOFRL domain [Cinara cedri]